MPAATVPLDPLDKRIVKKGKPVARRGRKVTGFEKRRPGCHYDPCGICAPSLVEMLKRGANRR